MRCDNMSTDNLLRTFQIRLLPPSSKQVINIVVLLQYISRKCSLWYLNTDNVIGTGKKNADRYSGSELGTVFFL